MIRTRRVESKPLRSRSPGCPRTGRTYPRFLTWSDGHPEKVRANMMSLVHKDLVCITVGIRYVLFNLHLWMLKINDFSHLKIHILYLRGLQYQQSWDESLLLLHLSCSVIAEIKSEPPEMDWLTKKGSKNAPNYRHTNWLLVNNTASGEQWLVFTVKRLPTYNMQMF